MILRLGCEWVPADVLVQYKICFVFICTRVGLKLYGTLWGYILQEAVAMSASSVAKIVGGCHEDRSYGWVS